MKKLFFILPNISQMEYPSTIPELFQKKYPWLKKRRDISKHRTLYTLRSDILARYTDIWHRNRYPDTDRVSDIMKSIRQEKEIDNRIYLAYLQDSVDTTKLLCFDGNHRREALIRLYRTEGFTCWVDIDVLYNVTDTEVIHAFQRINQAVCLPDAYLTLEANRVHPCESFLQTFQNEWKGILVDKRSTRSPYCTKSDFIDLMDPLLKQGSEQEWMNKLRNIHQQNQKKIYSPSTDKICHEHKCYLFANGLDKLRKELTSPK